MAMHIVLWCCLLLERNDYANALGTSCRTLLAMMVFGLKFGNSMGGLVVALSIYYAAGPLLLCRPSVSTFHTRPVICMSARREHYLVFVELIFNELPTCLLHTTTFPAQAHRITISSNKMVNLDGHRHSVWHGHNIRSSRWNRISP